MDSKMNEQIRELAKQAGIFYYRKGKLQVDMEKFAELIVRECAEVAYKRSVHSGPSDIFKHFGVEE
jgi:hypothetical protein